jgi:hypothetical protein
MTVRRRRPAPRAIPIAGALLALVCAGSTSSVQHIVTEAPPLARAWLRDALDHDVDATLAILDEAMEAPDAPPRDRALAAAWQLEIAIARGDAAVAERAAKVLDDAARVGRRIDVRNLSEPRVRLLDVGPLREALERVARAAPDDTDALRELERARRVLREVVVERRDPELMRRLDTRWPEDDRTPATEDPARSESAEDDPADPGEELEEDPQEPASTRPLDAAREFAAVRALAASEIRRAHGLLAGGRVLAPEVLDEPAAVLLERAITRTEQRAALATRATERRAWLELAERLRGGRQRPRPLVRMLSGLPGLGPELLEPH